MTIADFGNSRPNILIVLSILAFAIGFGWLGVQSPDKWEIASGMYIVGRELHAWELAVCDTDHVYSYCVPNMPHVLDRRLSRSRTKHSTVEGQGGGVLRWAYNKR